MDPNVLIALLAVLLTLFVALAGLAAYILKAKIGPIEKSAAEGGTKLEAMNKTLVDTLKTITDDNAAFRLKWTEDMGELKLLLSEKYASKEELEKLKELYDKLLERVQALEK